MLFRKFGTMSGDQFPCPFLHPCVGAHYRSRTMLAMIEGVVGFVIGRDSSVAIRANLEVTHLLLVGLVGLWVAHILEDGGLGVPSSPTVSTGVILGVVSLDKRIGSASCRERVQISVVGVSLKKGKT